MEVHQWPIVGRTQLVQAFRPGEPAGKEAPFRTLRLHGWATAGVSIVTRSEHRATGRLSIFSVLNVDAARLARDGQQRLATSAAKAAASLEASDVFVQLGKLLAGKSSQDVSAAVAGEVADTGWPELLRLLRLLARRTKAARARLSGGQDVIAGTISETRSDYLVLTAASGLRTAVPRWLAQAAHREKVGDCLALVTDRLDDRHMVVNAVPGIDVSKGAAAATFSAFGRTAPVRQLTKADARLLSRPAAPLRVLVPVTIDS